MAKKHVDEWGFIVQKQAELNKQRELEEKKQAQLERERYRQELEQQARLHAEQKALELRQKEAEALIIKQQYKAFERSEQQKKQNNASIHKNLAEEYISQANSIKTRQNLENMQKLNEEKEQVLYNRSLLEQERLRKAEMRGKLHEEDMRMLDYKTQEERMKRLEAKRELEKDLELMRKRKETEEKKERDYQEYYENVQKKQNLKQQLYSKQVGAKLANKDLEINNWVNKNIYQYNQTVEEKLDRDKRNKQSSLEDVRETLKYQVNEKTRQEQLKIEEQKRVTDEVQRKIEENKRIAEENEKNRRIQQGVYRNHLSNQALEIADVRGNAYKLSEFERKINRNASLDIPNLKSNLSSGAYEILKPNNRAGSISIENPQISYRPSSFIQKPFESVLKQAKSSSRPVGIF